MSTVTRANRNLWLVQKNGIYAPTKNIVPKYGLSLYAPLWHPELSGSSFTSKEPSGVTCTVTGATWGILGRTFNNTANRIALAQAKPVTAYTFCAWCKWTALPAVQGYIYMDADDGYSWMRVNADGSITADTYDTTSHTYSTAAGVISAGTWYFITNVVDIPNDVRQIWVDTTLSKNDTTNVNNLGGASNWLLGYSATSLGGIMGEALIFSTVLVLADITQIRRDTKWRF